MPTGILDRALFSQVVAQREGEEADNETSTVPAAQADPADSDSTADQDATGQDLSPEQTSTEEAAAEAESTEGNEVETEVLSQTDDAELTEALTGLDESARRKLIEIAKAVKAGEETIGGVKRIHKLTSEVEELRAKVAELQQTSETTASAVTPADLPKSVAELKTIKDVEARARIAEENADAIQDFLDANPGSADTIYDIKGKEFTRQQLIEQRSQYRAELKALPKRADQLIKAQEFQQTRQAATAAIRRDYPMLNDPEHPETKAVRDLMRDPKFSDVPNAEYLALAMITGNRVLQAELSNRKGKLPAGKPVVVKPQGRVPSGKPHSSVGGVPPRVKGDGVSVDSAISQLKKDGSRNSFAALLEATGL